jgi:glycopeptide antibiotics resistance protein
VAEHQMRSVNVIPFLGFGQTGRSETVSNLVVLVPFGLLLGVNFKDTQLWRLITATLVLSVVVETLQFILAIGITDVTDVIMNTLGGLCGLVLYRLVNTVMRTEILDWIIAAVGTILGIVFILLRLFVFQVRY